MDVCSGWAQPLSRQFGGSVHGCSCSGSGGCRLAPCIHPTPCRPRRHGFVRSRGAPRPRRHGAHARRPWPPCSTPVLKRWHRHQDKHFEVQTGLTSLILSEQQVAPVFLHLRAQAWASQFAMLEMLSNAVLGDLLSRSISFLLAKYEKQETDGGRAGGTEARLRRLLLRSGNMVEEAERWLSSRNGPCSGSSGP